MSNATEQALTRQEDTAFRPLEPMGTKRTLQSLLEKQAGALRQVLPRHVTAERLLKTVLLAVNRQPALLECTQESVLESVGRAAELGLDVSGTLGEGYLVPFNNKIKLGDREVWKKQCTFIPGYRGLAKLARQSGEIARLEANVVCEKDAFDFEQGTDFKLRYRRSLDDDRGAILGAYALAQFKDGTYQAEWMTRAEIEGIRARSKSKDGPAWRNDWGEMARKTVFRRLSKWLPLSGEKWERALEADNIDYDDGGSVIDLTPEPDDAAQEAVKRILEAKEGRPAEKAAPPPEPEESPARTEVRERAEAMGLGGDDGDPEHPQPMADVLRRRLLKEVGGVGPKVIGSLEAAGAITMSQIYHLGASGLRKLPGIGPQTADNLIGWCSQRIDEQMRREATEKPTEPPEEAGTDHEASEDPPDIPFGEEIGQQEEVQEAAEEGAVLSEVQVKEIQKALHGAENRFGSLDEAEEFRENYLVWVKKALGADSIPMIPAEAYGLAIQRILINQPPPRKASASVAG